MEYLDLYDENKNLIGETVLRCKDMRPQPGKNICIVIVFIENSEGKFLIQYTSKEKGNVWATTGGLVKSGSTCDQAIIEEIQEELGLNVTIDELKHIYTQKNPFAFTHIYYLKKDINIDDLILQEEEVELVKWLSVDEINDLIEQDKLRKGNILGFQKVLEYKNKE